MALNKINPKTRYVSVESDRVALEKLTNAEWYYSAVQSALAHYIRNVTMDSSELEACAKFHAIRGAREFSEMLLTMADRPKPQDGATMTTLNHNM